ncbi:MAG: hypothetical protein JJ900_18170 [Rhodospirillales bacterium]|nr:hypothetical protein [Rhodospirillales bacterium]MBO6788779.1 hypothetical protein [Rhodospirillales bacterium]
MRRHIVFAAIIAAGFTFFSNKADAAPQILAALPVESGIALKCADGICVAELSTYCLQRERPAPSMGTAYVPAKPEQFTLVLSGENGTSVRVPAGDHMTFLEHRGFMAVAATIEMGRLKALGATNAKLVVWRDASLIPVPQANDPDPLTDDEIAFVTDSLRQHGKSIVDSTPKAATAQLLAKLNSALPVDGPITAKSFDGMWQSAIGDEVPLGADTPGLTGARDAFNDCIDGTSTYRLSGLKRCIDYRHDDLLRNLNIEYWQNQPGS